MHKEYVAAGSNIITSSSYQVSYDQFQRVRNFDKEQTNELLRTSLNLARQAVNIKVEDEKPLVAGSIGCYGAHLADGSEYNGGYGFSMSANNLRDWHQDKFDFIVSELQHSDILAFETIPCINEVKAASSLLQSLHKPIDRFYLSFSFHSFYSFYSWISLACRSSEELNSGERVKDAIRIIDEMTPTNVGVGCNCCDPMEVEALIHQFRECISRNRLVVVYPNGGGRWDSNQGGVVPGSGMSDEVMAGLTVGWVESGADIVGGCCGTTPDTIRRVGAAIRDKRGSG